MFFYKKTKYNKQNVFVLNIFVMYICYSYNIFIRYFCILQHSYEYDSTSSV